MSGLTRRRIARGGFLLLLLAAAAAAWGAEEVDARRERHLLIRDLGDTKFSARAEAEKRLVRLGEGAVPDLILALEGRHRAVTTMAEDRRDLARARAARVLGAIGGARAARHLLKALDGKTERVRDAAIGALGALRCKEAVPRLVKLLVSGGAAPAREAALALGAIGDRSAAKELVELLRDRVALEDRYRDGAAVSRVRSAAAFALGMLGDTSAVPALLGALRDPDLRVRTHANLALRKMSGRDLRFDPKAPAGEREKLARAWDAWWKAKLK